MLHMELRVSCARDWVDENLFSLLSQACPTDIPIYVWPYILNLFICWYSLLCSHTFYITWWVIVPFSDFSFPHLHTMRWRSDSFVTERTPVIRTAIKLVHGICCFTKPSTFNIFHLVNALLSRQLLNEWFSFGGRGTVIMVSLGKKYVQKCQQARHLQSSCNWKGPPRWVYHPLLSTLGIVHATFPFLFATSWHRCDNTCSFLHGNQKLSCVVLARYTTQKIQLF